MLLIGSNEIGGGFVRRPFTDGTRRRIAGEKLTAAEIKAFGNHTAMIRTGMIAVYPPVPAASTTAVRAPRHVVSAGSGRFDVFEGRKVNKAPLIKEEAEALAAAGNGH